MRGHRHEQESVGPEGTAHARVRGLPVDRLKYRLQPPGLFGIDHLHVADAAFQVGAEVGAVLAVLGGGAAAGAVGEDGFEAFEVAAAEAEAFVHHDAGERLACAAAHDARLVVVHSKTFFQRDGGGVSGEALNGAIEIGSARESEIVGVAGVDGAGRSREAGQTAIEMEGHEIGERGRCGSPLGKMRAHVEGARVVPQARVEVDGAVAPEGARGGVRTDAAQAVGDRLGVAERAEQSLDTRGGEGGEEMVEVEAQNHGLSGMGRGESGDGSAFHEAVNRGVDRDAIEDFHEDAALELFQLGLRCFQQTHSAGALRHQAIVVMLQRGAVALAAEAFEVGEPFEFARVERKPSGEIAGGFDRGKIPACSCRDGTHTLRLGEPVGHG